MKRRILMGATGALLLAARAYAQAADQSERPGQIRMIIPFAPGGPIDTIGRLMADKLGAELGGTIVVDNRASGGGVVAGQAVARGPQDGSMLMFAAGSNLTIAPHLSPLPYDVRTAFAPVTRVVLNGSGLAINGKIPVNTVPELITWTKTRGGPLRMGSNGIGSIAHAWLELFRRATGLEILHVPYRGAGPAIVATVSGEVDAMFSDLLVQLPHVEGGALKSIGLIGPDRHPSRPEIPTIKEQGFPGVDGLSWSGIVAPAGTPPAITHRIAEAVAKVMREPTIRERLNSLGAAPATMSPEEFGKLLAEDYAWWGRTVRENNIRLE